MTYPRFWMVWSPEGRPPAYKHLNRADAVKEARRLAELAPGRAFFVLKAVGGFSGAVEVKPIGLEDLTAKQIAEREAEEIPF